MGLNEFASYYPDDFNMLNENVKYVISKNNMTGKESLSDLDNMVDEIVSNFDQDSYCNECEMWSVQYQQMPFRDGGRGFDRDRDRGRDRDRRRFRDFDLRDVIRLLFLRQLFDGRRRH